MQLTAGEADRIAEVMGGLSTAARVLILARLLEAHATVTEITDELDMSQTLVSNHLRILRHLSLASGERHGRHSVDSLPVDHVRALGDLMLTLGRHE